VATDIRLELSAGTTAAAGSPNRAGPDSVGAPPVVRATGVTRHFGARPVLDGLDLTIGSGEFVALLGRSGTGKSTLLRILAGLDRGFEGRVEAVTDRAVVFQEPRLVPWQRVLANVALGLGDREARRRATRALEEVGLGDQLRAWPATLSGGEAQRVALARALVRRPHLILADEPFGALDALTRLKMHALMAELWARHRPAVLLVTHDVDEAIVLADRVAVLDRGRLIVDRAVDLPGRRDRHHRGFIALRADLLEALGVRDGAAPA
jgi:sulfonate transport system ATP-binding protein